LRYLISQANERLKAKGKAPAEGASKPWWQQELEEAERQLHNQEDDDAAYFRCGSTAAWVTYDGQKASSSLIIKLFLLKLPILVACVLPCYGYAERRLAMSLMWVI